MTSLKNSLLPAAVFITGASVLIVEVVAVRVLSPYYGNTIFTVSSVISVILLALSVGYYAGGKLADRHPSLQWFFGIILVSGLLLLLFYFLGSMVLPVLSSSLSISMGPLVSALLFLLPALLLGSLSPYAVKLHTVCFPGQGVGSVAGKIFFWSTLGSIIGSLFAGFVLIPNFGIDRILIGIGVLLFVLGLAPLFVFGAQRKYLYSATFAFLLLLVGVAFAVHQATGKVVYSKDGVYQKITIYDGTFVSRPTRFLQQDWSSAGTGSAAMFLDSDDPRDLVYEYTKYYSLYKIFTPGVKNALVIGGGAYSVPKALLQESPSTIVDVAEIEPSLFDLSKKYFRVLETPRLNNHIEDGRRLLRDSEKKYDLIFSDVYYSFFSVPAHFTTKEFFTLVKNRLNPDGVFIANMVGDLSRQQPSLIMSEIRTFQSAFPNSYFFAVEAPEQTYSQNIMLVGYNSERRIDLGSPSIARHEEPVIRFLRYKVIDVNRRFDLSPYPLITDNFSPVEYLTARVLQRAFRERKVVDGSEMLAVVDQQLRYGPRYWGAAGHEKTQDFLLAEMKDLAQDVTAQKWKQTGPDGRTYELTNIIGRLYSAAKRRVVLATHYDSQRFAESRTNHSASGVAVLVELARTLINSPVVPRIGVDIVFFDGGEAEDQDNNAGWKPLGSTYFAEHLNEVYGSDKPVSGIVLDRVCYQNLRLLKERSSVENAPAQVTAFWNFGQKIDTQAFQDRIGAGIVNDHTALNQAGIPSVLVSDLRYSHFHTQGDTPNKCTAKSMETVAQAVLNYLNSIQ